MEKSGIQDWANMKTTRLFILTLIVLILAGVSLALTGTKVEDFILIEADSAWVTANNRLSVQSPRIAEVIFPFFSTRYWVGEIVFTGRRWLSRGTEIRSPICSYRLGLGEILFDGSIGPTGIGEAPFALKPSKAVNGMLRRTGYIHLPATPGRSILPDDSA
jgi:hypothetical protein